MFINKLILVFLLLLLDYKHYRPYRVEWVEPSFRVAATCYQPVEGQTNAQYNITASGRAIDTLRPLKHRWIAVSRDLEKLGFVFGARVLICGSGVYDGVWEVQDRMNKRWENKIDFLIGESDDIGSWKDLTIQLWRG